MRGAFAQIEAAETTGKIESAFLATVMESDGKIPSSLRWGRGWWK